MLTLAVGVHIAEARWLLSTVSEAHSFSTLKIGPPFALYHTVYRWVSWDVGGIGYRLWRIDKDLAMLMAAKGGAL